MSNKVESSQYSRISGSFKQCHDYGNNTLVFPRCNRLLPSIYEISSDFHFPNHATLDDFIYGDIHGDFVSSEAEQNVQNYQNDSRPNKKENFIGKTDLKEEIIDYSVNFQKIPTVNTHSQPNEDIQAYQYRQNSYSPNDLHFRSKPVEHNYFVQYQLPLNSIIPQISEDSNSPPFIENSGLIDQCASNNFQSNKIGFFNLTSRIEDHSRILLDPIELRFIPADQWTKGKVSLDHLKKDFFCARSSKCLRFEYKLWNALQITKHYPYLFKEIGVRWIAKSYIMVHRDIFGHLLQVTRPSAALFSSCGMFMTHGFREIMLSEVRNTIDPREITAIDESIVRLFAHKANDFNEDSGAADIVKIKWNNESRKKIEKW